MCKDPKTVELFEVGASIRDRYVETSKKCDINFLYSAIDLVNSTDLNYRLSRNKRLLSDLMIIKLCQLGSDSNSETEKKNSELKPIFSKIDTTVADKPAATPSPGMQSTPAQSQHISKPKPKFSETSGAASKSIGGLGVSIASVLAPKKDDSAKVEVQSEVLNESFTSIQLINAWKAYIAEISEEHHLKNTMMNCLPELLDKNTFEVVVNNPVQEQRLTEQSTNILTALRQNLKNTNIVMRVRITEDNEKNLAYTNKEKYELMLKLNPHIQKLKDEFGLELL